jgi:hypothetical protein
MAALILNLLQQPFRIKNGASLVEKILCFYTHDIMNKNHNNNQPCANISGVTLECRALWAIFARHCIFVKKKCLCLLFCLHTFNGKMNS